MRLPRPLLLAALAVGLSAPAWAQTAAADSVAVDSTALVWSPAPGVLVAAADSAALVALATTPPASR